jgi:hypothetical protein
MALIVEDGTGKTDAESYISVADADTYFNNRGNATWAALTSTAKEQALRKATDYMQASYTLRWDGIKVSSTQALDWPRAYVEIKQATGGYSSLPAYYVDNAVPVVVANACAELAVRASAADLLADAGAQVKQEVVGPLSVTYADGARQTTRYELVERMLAPLFKMGGAVQVVRA